LLQKIYLESELLLIAKAIHATQAVQTTACADRNFETYWTYVAVRNQTNVKPTIQIAPATESASKR